MNLRKEIETLSIWYIPVAIAMVLASGLVSNYFQQITSTTGTTIGSTVAFLAGLPKLIQLADNLVVGIWLYHMAGKEGGRKALWLIFGVFAHLFAAAIYVGVRIYEQQAFNTAQANAINDAA